MSLGLKEMQAGARKGECICCGDPALPLSTSKDSVRHRKDKTRTHRDTCGDEICLTAWLKFWRRDHRRMLREMITRLKAVRNAQQAAQ